MPKFLQIYSNTPSITKLNKKPPDESHSTVSTRSDVKSKSSKVLGKVKSSKNNKNHENDDQLFIGPTLPTETQVVGCQETVINNCILPPFYLICKDSTYY